MGDHHALDPHLAVGLVYFDFGDGGNISFRAVVLDERDAASASCPLRLSNFLRRRPIRPAGSLCCSFENSFGARIDQMPQTKLQRIHARPGGELIHERFVSERVLRRAESSQCRGPDRARVQPVNHHPVVLEVVGMIGVAIGARLVGFARRHSR